MALLGARNLGCDRDGVPILRGVSFELAAGQALILRGPNGIGKTTLLRTLCGLQPAAAGDIQGDTQDIAYAAHADGNKSTLTVRENLETWARIYGQSDAETAIAAFDLAALANRPAGQLSAGQKRRLGLARLLVTGRPVWALDEPTVSLDAAAQTLLQRAFDAHLKGGGALIVSTHVDLDLDARELDLSAFRPRRSEQSDAAFGEAVE